jgi:hypothetical protein
MVPTLSAEEARVLGCLIEKQMTTPEYYPMTVNALVAAASQKTNREPVSTYDEELVEGALARLNDKGLPASPALPGPAPSNTSTRPTTSSRSTPATGAARHPPAARPADARGAAATYRSLLQLLPRWRPWRRPSRT